MNRPAIKAGMVGGAAAVVLNLLGLIPAISCCVLILQWMLFVAVGALAASWLLPPRQSGQAAGEGALAGLITGLISGLSSMLLAPLSFAQQGGAEAILRQLPPEQLQQLEEAGVDFSMFLNTGSILAIGAGCCAVTVVVAVALGALGGLIGAAINPGSRQL